MVYKTTRPEYEHKLAAGVVHRSKCQTVVGHIVYLLVDLPEEDVTECSVR